MEEKLKELTIEEKVGQMLMIGMDMPNVINHIDDIILKYKVGGILLYKKNYKNYEELIDLINYIKKINTANKIPLFIAVDQEGGRVNRMPPEFENLPSAYKLAGYQEEDLVETASKLTGRMLQKVGINFDFAPVLDVKRFEDKHAIGDRAFSDDIEKISKCAITYIKGLEEYHVVPVMKHFPGHGSTDKDSHFILPTIKKSMEELEKEDMVPFKNGIDAGADCLLVSHLQIKGITKYPCSMSRKFITKYIRKKYRFKGIIITDDMKMKGVELLYGKKKPIKKAFEAGNDIIVMKYGKDEKLIKQLIEDVKHNKRKEARVNRSVNRILKIKEKYQCNHEEVEKDEDFIKEINHQIMVIKDKIQPINQI